MKALLEGFTSLSSVWPWRVALFAVALAATPAHAAAVAGTSLPPSNDMFAASQHMEGTNWTYTGNFTFATREPNEPQPEWVNTVWLSWAAPSTGRATLWMPRTFQLQYYAAYTGSDLAKLQEVPLMTDGGFSLCFLATEGTIYHFQIAGGADDYTFTCRLDEFLSATNDHFANATELKPNTMPFEPMSVAGATMELGEPLHRSDGPQKSIWWKWQSPGHGNVLIQAGRSLIPNVVLAIYQGPSVAGLKLVGKGTNEVRGPVIGGETYYIAGAVPADAVGDIWNWAYLYGNNASIPIPGNLLREPSWEGTALVSVYWVVDCCLGGHVNSGGGADGTTWPTVGSHSSLWQDFNTTPGRTYTVRFAAMLGDASCCGEGRVRVLWNDALIGVAEIPEVEQRYWHWFSFTTVASNSTTRLLFNNIGVNLDMDAFSVVDLSAPPSIVNQPSSVSTVAGGSAAFVVGVNGSEPLHYQWLFNGAPLSGATRQTLLLDSATPAQAGQYRVTITNAFGSVTSAPAALLVDDATNVTIFVQPYGDTVPVNGYYNLSVVAGGTPPLTYQWYRNDQPIAEATNRNLMLISVQPSDAGSYEVRVQNYGGTVWSLPAMLTVSTNVIGGGLVQFENRTTTPGVSNNEAPIFDVDGVTKLNGGVYVAQLYAGPSLESLRPAGEPSPFQSGFQAGYFVSQTVTLANVPPGGSSLCQVRVWESDRGTSYEEARALGGKFGKSDILEVQPSGPPDFPAPLIGLTSFSLQAGLPEFAVGQIEFVERQPGGVILWQLHGEAAFRYLIEKSSTHNEIVWRPYAVVTNVTGTVTFSDSAQSGAAVVLYRGRILD